MLFQSDYWLARNYAQKLETILDFLETDEGIKTLVIVDMNINDQTTIILESIKGDLTPCIDLINSIETLSYKGKESYKKTIYVYTSLQDAVPTIELTQPILAIFI